MLNPNYFDRIRDNSRDFLRTGQVPGMTPYRDAFWNTQVPPVTSGPGDTLGLMDRGQAAASGGRTPADDTWRGFHTLTPAELLAAQREIGTDDPVQLADYISDKYYGGNDAAAEAAINSLGQQVGYNPNTTLGGTPLPPGTHQAATTPATTTATATDGASNGNVVISPGAWYIGPNGQKFWIVAGQQVPDRYTLDESMKGVGQDGTMEGPSGRQEAEDLGGLDGNGAQTPDPFDPFSWLGAATNEEARLAQSEGLGSRWDSFQNALATSPSYLSYNDLGRRVMRDRFRDLNAMYTLGNLGASNLGSFRDYAMGGRSTPNYASALEGLRSSGSLPGRGQSLRDYYASLLPGDTSEITSQEDLRGMLPESVFLLGDDTQMRALGQAVNYNRNRLNPMLRRFSDDAMQMSWRAYQDRNPTHKYFDFMNSAGMFR